MSQSAAQYINALYSHFDEAPEPVEQFLPLQLAETAAATSRLVFDGLAVRGVTGEGMKSVLINEAGEVRAEVAHLVRAYEAALLTGLSPTEVKTLRRLLTRVELAAQRLAGER